MDFYKGMVIRKLSREMEHLLSTKKLITAIILIAVCWYIKFLIKRRRLYHLGAQFNGPRSLPIIGDLLNCIMPHSEMAEAILNSTSRYKSPQRFWFGPKLIVHVFDPENLKIVLNSPHALEKQPKLYKLLEDFSGRGLLTSPVEEWRRHRKLMGPSYNQKFLDGFFDTFSKHSKNLVHSLKPMEGKEVFDAQNYLIKYAMDSVMDTLLGFTGDDDYSERIASCIQEIFSAITIRVTSIWYHSDIIFRLSPYGRKVLKIKKEFDKYLDSFIAKWENISMQNKENRKFPTDSDSSKPKKFIEHLLAISDGSANLTAEELRGEVNTVIAAGLESTSSIVGYLLILLGMHPEVQEKVHREILQVVGSKQQLELDDLKDLEYLERIIKEGLRLFPSALGIARFTTEEIQLTNHTIPANTTVAIGILALHRNPDIWPNPNKFDPDRFLPEKEAERHLYCWIPFSAGPRNCIGMRFAVMSLKVVMSTLITKYHVTTNYKRVEDINLTVMFKLQPTNGFKIGITPR